MVPSLADGSLLREYKGVASDLLTRGSWKKMNKESTNKGGGVVTWSSGTRVRKRKGGSLKRFDKLRTRDHLAVNYIFFYISSSSSSFSSTLAVISPILLFPPFLSSSSAIPLRLYFTCRYSQVNHPISIHICTYKYIHIYICT